MAYDLFDANNKLNFQHGLSQMLNSCVDLNQGLDIVLRTVMSIEHIDCGGIYVTDPVSGNFNLIVYDGLSPEFLALVSYYDADSPAIRAAATGNARYGSYRDFPQIPGDALIHEKLKCIASIPIMVQKKLIAILNLGSRSVDDIPQTTRIELETLASSIGNAVMRLQSDAALRLSEEKYRRITENMSDIIFEVDARGIIKFISPSYLRIFGEKPDNLIGTSIFDIIHPEDIERVLAKSSDAILQKSDIEVEYRFRHPEGHFIWLRSSGHALFDDNGHVMGSIFSSNDITDRKLAQLALLENEKKYRQLFTHAPAGILEVDFVNQRFIKVNSLICEYTGFSEAEMLSMSPLDILTEESRDLFIARLNDMISGKPVSKSAEFKIKEKNEHTRWVELNNEFIWQDGKITGSTVVIHDITERKHADQKIRDLLAEKDILLKEVHHRIKNNMITIISLLSLQARRMKNPAASDALNDAGNRLRSMQVLYDKLYRSEIFQDMLISNYLPSLVDEIKSSFPESGSLEIVKEIGDFMISAELLPPLGMIVNELLTNAIKYAFTDLDAGTIKITASMQDNRATIIIEDNGIGISESVDIENATSFGLWLVNTLIRQIGGMIRIERNPGTRFIMNFGI